MIELEKLGIPTVSITSHGYEADFETSSKVFGFPALPYVVIPYTLTSRTEPQASGDADDVFGRLVETMTAPPPERELARNGKLREADKEAFSGTDRFDAWESFNYQYLDRGWGDGFPLIPPTPDRVQAFLKGVSEVWSPLDVVGKPFPPGEGMATVEKLAINCVMAGCEPQHLPVLIAAVEAMTETPVSRYPIRVILQSHAPFVPLMLINGPVAKRLGVNSGMAALGPGKQSRVNTVLGRALRLIIMNVAHCYPEELDLDTIGTPAKYSFCVAENEDENPWGEPFHVERGFKKEDSVVTVFGVGGMSHYSAYTGEVDKILLGLASKSTGGFGAGGLGIPSRTESDGGGSQLMMLCPDHARSLADGGQTKQSIRDYIVNNSPATPLKVLLANLNTGWESLPADVQQRISQMDPETMIQGVRDPSTIQFTVVGGPSAGSDLIQCIGTSITRPINI
jgi:hypothetical protein